MYALRDVTGTVRSIPLIVSSILSKKIAEGADALLLDVKFGRGAVYADPAGARELAQNLVDIGESSGLEIRALLTDMNQPLGRAVGNWLEVRECLDAMTGKASPADLVELSLAEAALMLLLGKVADDYPTARAKAEEALKSGAAFTKFVEIARKQGADVRCLEDPDIYPTAASQKDILCEKSGFVYDIDARMIGLAAVDLGAGRRRKEDRIDYTAGVILHKKRGERAEKGEPLATLYAENIQRMANVEKAVASAFELNIEAPPPRALIVSQLTKEGEIPWSE
jgi:pyrimidine-nucleoside phosphorylase